MNIYLQELTSFSLQNKYSKWYISIIQTALNRHLIDTSVSILQNRRRIRHVSGYVTSHHIIPVSINPELYETYNNIVFLTAREHFICHWLLAKMFSNKFKHKMIFAFRRMHHGKNGELYSGKYYSKLRSTMPPVNKDKTAITDGVHTKLYSQFEALPAGWYRGVGSNYCARAQERNNKVHRISFQFTNILTNTSFIVNDIAAWAAEHDIPYSTVISAARANTILRKQYSIVNLHSKE